MSIDIIKKFCEDNDIVIAFDRKFPDFIPWECLDKSLEGVIRQTNNGQWEMLADRHGNWDRCANADYRCQIPTVDGKITRTHQLMEAFENIKNQCNQISS